MRLPKDASGKIDLEQTKQMVDLFMDAGLTYFDTAYVYDGGDSERAAKAALVDRYPGRAIPGHKGLRLVRRPRRNLGQAAVLYQP